MKATLEFNLNESEDVEAFKSHSKHQNMKNFIFEVMLNMKKRMEAKVEVGLNKEYEDGLPPDKLEEYREGGYNAIQETFNLINACFDENELTEHDL